MSLTNYYNFKKQQNSTSTSRTPTQTNVEAKFKYEGNPEFYFKFYNSFESRLRKKSLDYLEDDERVNAAFVPIPEPPIRTYDDYLPDNFHTLSRNQKEVAIRRAETECRTISKRQEIERSDAIRERKDKVEKIETDAAKAFVEMQELLCDSVRQTVTAAYDNHVGSPFDKYRAASIHLIAHYGPTASTRTLWKRKLDEGIDPTEMPGGMGDAIAEYNNLVSNLTRTPDELGLLTPPSESDKRIWLKLIVQKGSKLNKSYSTLYSNVIMDGNMSSADITERLQNIVADIKASKQLTPLQKVKSNYITSSKSSSGYEQQKFRQGIADPEDERTFYSTNNLDRNNNRTNSNSSMYVPAVTDECRNCHAIGHIVRTCKSRICGKCMKLFDTLDARIKHTISRECIKRKQQDDENNSKKDNKRNTVAVEHFLNRAEEAEEERDEGMVSNEDEDENSS